MDPFRDELGAAHAKIARLEEHVQHLEGRRPAQQPKRLPHSMIVYILFAILIFVVLGAVTVIAFGALMRSGPTHRQSQGVKSADLEAQVHVARTIEARITRTFAR